MVILSEVKKPEKCASGAGGIGLRIIAIPLLLFFSTFGLAEAKDRAPDGLSASRLGDCNWQVTYRGHLYDLSPLTRETLARPIENDIRFVLQRVPEANAHLQQMQAKLREARGHTFLASFFVTGFIAAKIFQANARTEDKRQDFNVIALASGGLFLAATLFSWRASTGAKEELVNAVEEFNKGSPQKIEPAMGGEVIN